MLQLNRIIRVLLVLLSLSAAAQASHLAGWQIQYSCLNPCTTRVWMQVYRHCAGVNGFQTNVSWVPQSGCSGTPMSLGAPSIVGVQEVTPVCPGTVTMCTNPGSNISGIMEHTVYQDFDVCSVAPCQYEITWTDCCRNGVVQSLNNAATQGMTVGAYINTAVTPCNSSPVFMRDPIVYICAGQDADIFQGAMDLDGDSLSYHLLSCRDHTGGPVLYSSGFSALQPLGGSWNVSIDAGTGMVHLDANPGIMIGAVLCLEVREYRGGQLIGNSSRDLELIVVSCGSNENPTFAGQSVVSGSVVQQGPDAFSVMVGQAFCMDFMTADLDSGQAMYLTWVDNLSGATFSDANNALVLDTVAGVGGVPGPAPVGRLCWTPTVIGTYNFLLRTFDSNCLVYGHNDRWIRIEVVACTAATATATPGTCPDVQFQSGACFAGPYTYTWSGAGGFSSTSPNPSHTYPSVGTYGWQLIMSNGTVTDTVNGSVTVGGAPSPAPLLTGLSFLSPCTGNLYDTLDAGPGYQSYDWNTGATTQQLPVFLAGNYSVTVTQANGCILTDSQTVYWNEPDIYGVVSTSTSGPLQNQRVLLIQHDTTAQALWAVDSTWTDSSGYYFFCNVVDTLVYLKATPRQLDYPNELPTYADTTLFWNNAVQFLGVLQAPFRHDFATRWGLNPGGPGFIGGLIVQGANKTNGIGDPIIGMTVFLRDLNTGNYLGSRVTDANGYFIFSGIPYGDYEVVPDRPLVSTTNVPQVTLDAQHPGYNNLDFQMHRYWLELVMPTGVPVPGALAAHVAPNPFGEHASLLLELPNATVVSWELYDELGRKLQAGAAMEMGAGRHRVEVGQNLPSGLYLLNVHVGGTLQQARLVKMN